MMHCHPRVLLSIPFKEREVDDPQQIKSFAFDIELIRQFQAQRAKNRKNQF